MVWVFCHGQEVIILPQIRSAHGLSKGHESYQKNITVRSIICFTITIVQSDWWIFVFVRTLIIAGLSFCMEVVSDSGSRLLFSNIRTFKGPLTNISCTLNMICCDLTLGSYGLLYLPSLLIVWSSTCARKKFNKAEYKVPQLQKGKYWLNLGIQNKSDFQAFFMFHSHH